MPTTHRIYNFSAGPAVLPLPVLEQIQRDLVALPGVGMSILEISHRSKTFESILEEAEADIRALADIPDNYRVLFLQGGASLQFSMVPMNLLDAGSAADYLDAGSWADKAVEEARKVGRVHVAASTKAEHYARIPESARDDVLAGRRVRPHDVEQHDRGHAVPAAAGGRRRPARQRHLVRHVQPAARHRRHALVYAGAQKNMGPAGVTLVIIRDDLVSRAASRKSSLPAMMSYAVHAEHRSLYNTPPVFAVYALGLVMKWLLARGGSPASRWSTSARPRGSMPRSTAPASIAVPRPAPTDPDERHLPARLPRIWRSGSSPRPRRRAWTGSKDTGPSAACELRSTTRSRRTASPRSSIS